MSVRKKTDKPIAIAFCIIVAFCAGAALSNLRMLAAPEALPNKASVNDKRQTNKHHNDHGGEHPPTDAVIARDQHFRPLVRAPHDACYEGESEWDCAARIVQEGISSFYILLTLAACAQVATALFTIVILRQQTKIQIASQRPNIFVQTIDMEKFSEGAAKPIGGCDWFAFQVVWINTGQTSPANLSVGAAYQVRNDDDLPIGFDYTVERRNAIPIGRDMPYRGDPLFVTDAKIAQISAGERRLFIWGEGEYRDAFSPNIVHRVEFCYRSDFRGTYIDLRPHGPYNRTYDRPRIEADHDTPPVP